MKYDLDYNPPAPTLKIRLANPVSSNSVELRAKLDSGADMTVIPQKAIGELRLIPAGRISISSFDGREGLRYTYYVDLSLDGFIFPMVEVIDAKRRDALLGRDVLNLTKTILDGKTLSFEILDP